MSIIIDKRIICSIHGEISIKENCLYCFLVNKIKFDKTIDGIDYLKEFDCENNIDLVDVDLI